jgi:DNA-3-methyladenine glycosylase
LIDTGRPLPREFYARDTVRVARDLLGCILQTDIDGEQTAGRIVEVEAYIGPHDPADHGFENRRSLRNDALFGPPGSSYVFRSYGIHWCFNAVTERDGYPAAVLVRALEPLVGLAAMERRRGRAHPGTLCAGPGRLCQALGIDGAYGGHWLTERPVRILRPRRRPTAGIVAGPRVGISKAADWPLRFFYDGSPWISVRRSRR